MEFVTIADLNKDIIKNLYKIPQDIDLIIGIPRSGLFLGSIIALYLNKQLTDIDSFIENRIYEVGNTKNTKNNISSANEAKKILVVDDSVDSGFAIQQAKEKLQNLNKNIKIIYLAGYVRFGTKNLVDIYFREVNDDRVFEWNYMHHSILNNVCCDIDGVLCEDPTFEENDDGKKYKEFILNAKPKFIPSREIGCLVTSRLEKYRKETEYWLRKNSIKYKSLYMMDNTTSKERMLLCNHGKFKAEIYKKVNNKLFIESNIKQAEEIANLTGKFVFCIENQKFYSGSKFNKIQDHYKNYIERRIKNVLKQILPKNFLNYYRNIKHK